MINFEGSWDHQSLIKESKESTHIPYCVVHYQTLYIMLYYPIRVKFLCCVDSHSSFARVENVFFFPNSFLAESIDFVVFYKFIYFCFMSFQKRVLFLYIRIMKRYIKDLCRVIFFQSFIKLQMDCVHLFPIYSPRFTKQSSKSFKSQYVH